MHLPLSWFLLHCAGLLAGTEEAKVSSVRAAALAALQPLLSGSGSGSRLPEAERLAIKHRLAAMAASERVAALAAQASSLVGTIGP